MLLNLFTPSTSARQRYSRRAIALLCPILIAASANAELIPAARLANWQAGVTVGVPGGIPTNRTNIIDVTKAPYNANKTGSADASTAINSAIKAAPAGSVVYLPAGTYLINSKVSLFGKSDVTLRGAGASTVLDVRAGGNAAVHVGADTEWPWDYSSGGANITGGLTQGSSTLTLSDTSAFSAGSVAIITELNDTSLPVVHVSGNGDRLRQQKTRVVSKTSTSITISPPLLWTLGSGRAPKAHALKGRAQNTGVEDLKINLQNSSALYGIWMQQADRCWVKNVSVSKLPSFGIYFLDCFQSEMRGCDVRERKTVGNNGAGLFMERSSGCLIEDNIFYSIFPHIEVNYGSSGNVIAYNFCEENNVNGIMGVSIDANHGPHNQFNLYEGNVASKFQSDGYYGSASDDTAFRNWFHGTSDKTTQFGIGIYLNRFARRYNLVGNILGRTGYTFQYDNANASASYSLYYAYVFGLPNMGNVSSSGTAQLSKGDNWADGLTAPWPGSSGFQELDLDVAATVLRKGNWNAKDKAVPASESLGSDTLPSSLFRKSKPAFFGDLAWPPFNPANPNQNYTAIPAGYRYVKGTNPPNAGTGGDTSSGGDTSTGGDTSSGGGTTNPPAGGTDTTAPTAPQNLKVTASGSALSVSWSASTDSVGVTGYRLERSQGTGSTSYTQVATPTGTSYTDTSVTAGTVYNYRVRAVDAAGNLSGYSSVTSGQAGSGSTTDTAAPTTPVNVLAVPTGSNQVNVSWQASTDNVAVTGYRLERSQGAGSTSYTQVATPTGTSYSDTGLTAGTVYNYRVRAVDAAGNLSGYSATASATTNSTAPTTANGLVAAYGFDESAGTTVSDASGNSNTGNIVGATRVQGKNGTALSFNGVDNAVVVNSSASLNVSSKMTMEAWVRPAAAQTGWRAVLHRETDAWYLHSSSPAGALVPASGAIINGTEQYTAATTPMAVNTWTHLAMTYDGTTLREYVNGVQVASKAVSGTVQTNSKALRIGGNTYSNQYFQGLIDDVRVYNRALSQAEIQTDMNTPVGKTSVDTTAPEAPQTIAAVSSGANQANISWGASTDNVGVTAYRLERSIGAGSTTYTQIATPTGTSYSDTGLTAGTVYNYRVRAVDAAGNLSGYSNVATVTLATSTPTGLVAAYGFDESAGTTVSDASGNSNTGNIVGATRVQGKNGTALSFNGVDNVVVVNSSASLNVSSKMTMEAWVRPAAAQTGWRAVLHRETDAWYLHSSSPAGALVPASGAIINGTEQYTAATTPMAVNTWTHLAMTYDGTTLREYVNGVQVASKAVSGTVQTNSKALRIGGNTYANQYFQGLVDDVRIYNRALSQAEIQTDMNTPVGTM